jgi:hypothetical protein
MGLKLVTFQDFSDKKIAFFVFTSFVSGDLS